MYQQSEEEKNAMMRKGFYAFINSPNENDLMMEIYYKKLIDIGAMSITDEEKNAAYFDAATKMVDAPPYDYLIDRKIRKDLYGYQDYFKSVADKSEFKFSAVQDNFIHKIIVKNAKRNVVMAFLKQANKNELMDLYDLFQTKKTK